MSQVIRIKFTPCEDDQREIEAKAVDVRTGIPVASLPPKQMHAWLLEKGFQPKPSFQIWESAA